MKILLICTTIFRLQPKGLEGYGGLEQLVSQWAQEFAKAGHQVSVVCPEGSYLGDDIEIIPTALMENEQSAYLRYKDKLADFDCVMDNSWQWWSVIAQHESNKQLPIMHIYHSDPDVLMSSPPIQYPCIVSLSRDQGTIISRKWGVRARTIYNGIDLSFYKPNETKKSNRYLYIARFSNEKGAKEAIYLAKKCKVGLDLFGDTTLIANQNYLNQCMFECDGKQVILHGEITREQTVKEYQNHKGFIHWFNYNEAFGLTVVEAQACGCPVIARNKNAMHELIKNKKTGFLADTLEDAEEIIKEDLVSSIKPEDCVKQAKKFSIEKSAMKYLKLAQEIKDGIYW